MSKPIIKRRPHGPINPRFSLMWMDFKEGRVRFDLPSRPIVAAWNGDEIIPPAFDRYVAEISALAAAACHTDPGKPYCDADSWRDAYHDGLTPAEAWAEEVSNWETA
jgi:hypothetical protein